MHDTCIPYNLLLIIFIILDPFKLKVEAQTCITYLLADKTGALTKSIHIKLSGPIKNIDNWK